jgi:hypothetical protein
MDYPLRRRFKIVPERLEKVMLDELTKIEEHKRELENDEHFEKGGKIYKKLENLAADAVHEWINKETQVKFGAIRTRRHTDYSYAIFVNDG